MDPFLALILQEENAEENDEIQTEKKPKEKKKKLNAGALKKLQAKIAEEARQQLIKQKQEYLKETKKRVQQEWQTNQAKAQVYESEFESKLQQLSISHKRLSEIEREWKEHQKEMKKQKEWMKYLDCGHIPNPSSISQVNTYIFVWTEIESQVQMPYCMKKTGEVIQLLNALDEIIKYPDPDLQPGFLEDIKELRAKLSELLDENINRATFYLFSRIETDMVPINMTTSKFFAKCPHFHMGLWAELMTPIPSSRDKEVRHPLKVTFEEMNIQVIVPVSLLDIQKVMRAMWLNYDHWSDKCQTFNCLPLPSFYHKSQLELFVDEFETKKEIMTYRKKLEEKMKKHIAAIPPEPSLSQEICAWESEAQRALSVEIAYRECEEEDKLEKHVKAILNKFEVNLRERTMLGDLLLLEVLHQPPQPKYLRYKHSVTLREDEPKLIPVNFYVKYLSPEREDTEKTDDEKHEEAEKPKETKPLGQLLKLDFEEMKKLAAIELKPCSSVVWFENPRVANWDPDHNYWSTQDIHDITYDDEDGTISFKTGRFGLMGLHVHRYCNFPLEDWLFEANGEGGVNFYLKTAKSELNFKIKGGEVCLESMKDVPSKAMDWILGVYHQPFKLVELMRRGGIDVFPQPDATYYIKHIQSKHVVVESNIYQVWGLFATTFRFRRSKFNQIAGRGNIVFQAQEITKNHQVDYCLIQTGISSCCVLEMVEESAEYSPKPDQNMEICVDLYSLLYQNCTRHTRRQVDVAYFLLVQTVKDFMNFVRPLSFS